MTVLSIYSKKARDTQAALEVIDQLRFAIESGEVIGFAAVGIGRDDTTFGWTACTQHVSRLRVMGAIASLQHSYHSEEAFG